MRRPITLEKLWALSFVVASGVTAASSQTAASAEPTLPPLNTPANERVLGNKGPTAGKGLPPLADPNLRLVQQPGKPGDKPGKPAVPDKPDTSIAQQQPGGTSVAQPGSAATGTDLPSLPSTTPGTAPATGTTLPDLPASAAPTPSLGAGAGQSVARDAADLGATNVRAVTANQATQSEVLTRATTDVGDLLGKSQSITGVETQKRQPIANETRIRGYTLGQITTVADGAYWFPARQDLDTFLSKIDSGSVRDVIVLKGPYSAVYGPGFSFIDVNTVGAPRYQDGFKWEGRTSVLYKHNGEQFYGRQGVQFGDRDWGGRVSYGHRFGNDYRTGDGADIPSSYNVRDIDAALGFDLGSDSKVEVGYLRLDQTNIEFPGQIFDTEALVTNAYRVRFVMENQDLFDRFVADAFYNRTSLGGNAQHQGKRRRIPQLNDIGFQGFTDIDHLSTGYRFAFSWGDAREGQFTLGTDLRYLNGSLNEFDSTVALDPCGGALSNFPIPRNSHTTVGGVFAEYSAQRDERLNVKLGGRYDYVTADIKGVPPGFACPDVFYQVANELYFGDRRSTNIDFERDFRLMMLFATAEYKVNDNWRFTAGTGHAQRPPTQTELYALQPFLSVVQNGFTTVIGNPNLATEKLYQFDLGVKAEYDWLRYGTNGFAALVEDYITMSVRGQGRQGGSSLPGNIPGLTVQFVNTDLATLVGFEAYSEVDVTGWLTPFVVVSYVEGRDQGRGKRARDKDEQLVRDADGNVIEGLGRQAAEREPLPGIPPLESRLGVRFHEARVGPRYGLEILCRAVARQDRAAVSLREVKTPGFVVWDVRGYWQWRQGITLTAGIENVFDRNYQEHLDLRTGLGVFQPGINGYVGVEARY